MCLMYIISACHSVLSLLSKMVICVFLTYPHGVWFICAIKESSHIILFPETLHHHGGHQGLDCKLSKTKEVQDK